MKIVEPFNVTDAALIASNLVETAPTAVSGVTYNAYSATATYSAGTQVCHTFAPGYPYSQNYAQGLRYGGAEVMAIFTANASGTLNREPYRVYQTGSALPGYAYWTLGNFEEKYSATKTYGLGARVGYINGSTGAFYQSLEAGNVGNTPSSSPTKWRQTTQDSYATWSGETTYALDAQVAIVSGQMASVFTSLQAGNLNKAPQTETAWWRYDGDTYKAWASGTTYAAGDIVIDTRTHHEYESAVGSNTGNDPTDSANVPSFWLDRGATNRWAMFDTSNSSASTAGDEIDVTVQLTGVNDTVALLGLAAQEVQIIAYDGVTLVYDETFDLTNTGAITDWRHYFFDPVTYAADLIINDLPTNPDIKVRCIVTNTGGEASIGAAIFGYANEIGGTVYGASAGILSFSRKVVDDYGNATLVPRANSKRGEFRVAVTSAMADEVLHKLAALDAVAVLYQGSDLYASTWVFGFYRDHALSIDTPSHSYLTIQIEGLI